MVGHRGRGRPLQLRSPTLYFWDLLTVDKSRSVPVAAQGPLYTSYKLSLRRTVAASNRLIGGGLPLLRKSLNGGSADVLSCVSVSWPGASNRRSPDDHRRRLRDPRRGQPPEWTTGPARDPPRAAGESTTGSLRLAHERRRVRARRGDQDQRQPQDHGPHRHPIGLESGSLVPRAGRTPARSRDLRAWIAVITAHQR